MLRIPLLAKLSLKSLRSVNRLQAVLVAIILVAVGVAVVVGIFADDGIGGGAVPQVALYANNQSSYQTSVNSQLYLSWRITNSPSTCTASGGVGNWPGPKADYGGTENRSADTASAGTITYTLTCSNSAGSGSGTVTVTVVATQQLAGLEMVEYRWQLYGRRKLGFSLRRKSPGWQCRPVGRH